MSKTRTLSENLFDYGYFKTPMTNEALKKEILWSLEIFQMYFSKSFKEKNRVSPRGWNRKGYRFKRNTNGLVVKESFTFSIGFLNEFLASEDFIFGSFTNKRLQELVFRLHEMFMEEIFEAFNMANGLRRLMELSANSWSIKYTHYLGQKGVENELPSSTSNGLFTALLHETAQGTEFKTKNGWQPVSSNHEDETCLLFYAGKELEKVTEGEVRAVEHRTVVPPGGRTVIKVFPDHY